MRTFGDPGSAGAIFVFKGDGTEDQATKAARVVANNHHANHIYSDEERRRVVDVLGYDPTDKSGRFVYVVETENPDEFLKMLSDWNQNVSGEDAALLIYAHMGEHDIGPSEDGPGVTWCDLADAIPRGVSSLWLAGCESEHCTSAWANATPIRHPVHNWLVCTRVSIHWSNLISHFTKEISLDPIAMPNEISKALHENFKDNIQLLERRDCWEEVTP